MNNFACADEIGDMLSRLIVFNEALQSIRQLKVEYIFYRCGRIMLMMALNQQCLIQKEAQLSNHHLKASQELKQTAKVIDGVVCQIESFIYRKNPGFHTRPVRKIYRIIKSFFFPWLRIIISRFQLMSDGIAYNKKKGLFDSDSLLITQMPIIKNEVSFLGIISNLSFLFRQRYTSPCILPKFLLVRKVRQIYFTNNVKIDDFAYLELSF